MTDSITGGEEVEAIAPFPTNVVALFDGERRGLEELLRQALAAYYALPNCGPRDYVQIMIIVGDGADNGISSQHLVDFGEYEVPIAILTVNRDDQEPVTLTFSEKMSNRAALEKMGIEFAEGETLEDALGMEAGLDDELDPWDQKIVLTIKPAKPADDSGGI